MNASGRIPARQTDDPPGTGDSSCWHLADIPIAAGRCRLVVVLQAGFIVDQDVLQ